MATARIFNLVSPGLYIIVTSIFMMIGVLFFNWSAATILFAYFFETFIIGIIHFFKMLSIALWGNVSKSRAENFFQAIFFVVHFGGFLAGQSIFLFVILDEIGGYHFDSPFNIINNFLVLMKEPYFIEIFGLLFISELYRAIKYFFSPKKYRTVKSSVMLFLPYPRIFIQQFVVLLGFFMVLLGQGSTAAAILLILMRLAAELMMIHINNNDAIKEKIVNHIVSRTQNKFSKQTIAEGLNDFFEYS